MYSQPLEDRENRLNLLSLIDLKRIEDTGLSKLDKHFIRLMAHCLACFKKMVPESSTAGPLPSSSIRSKWLYGQFNELIDESFLTVLLEQFVSAANQLEHIADHFEISPLELTLEDLIQFVQDEEKT